MNLSSKIYIAGHRGLAGSAIVRELQRQGYTNLVMRTHAELDLEDVAATLQFFKQERPEVVESGVTGHLGIVGDVVGMAGAALAILGDEQRWQAMSAAAVRRASALFATDKVLPLYESLYAAAVR